MCPCAFQSELQALSQVSTCTWAVFLTVMTAQAPKFATDARARKVQHKSHDELEAEEMASMPHFKAKALK